ncbi:hypothetical protein KEM60_00743 [Austwickia sp. TVS 96-490-7B]|uniref:alpha/beta hydrolase n=1 Tax=Austwickia sp. TVS 96-490-7B TaxID=2830843 RepID=UPI001C5A1C0C|nr:alpha/beta hydrolase [Austwickia sp. TVS 96-490-7B]MBW3084555.1 hypothetical protein [Austwickia sp. TVS 96-490-7B]
MRTLLTVATAVILAPLATTAQAAPMSTTSPAAAPAAIHAADPTGGAPTPALDWQPCSGNSGYECTKALVPLDYAAPQGPFIELSLQRLPARNADERQGSIFINPGGPGGSALESLSYFVDVLGNQVTQNYDVVAMDPRGIGESSKMVCWSRQPGPGVELASYPTTKQQYNATVKVENFIRTMCGESARPILDHMSTGDVARDLELLRKAIGDDVLNFYGMSYGTHLGATYAAMFPQSTGRMILDGVLDPVEWTTGRGNAAKTVPVAARVGSAASAEETLRAAFAACRDAGSACRAGARIEEEWDSIIGRLRQGPAVGASTAQYTLETELSTAAFSLAQPEGIRSVIQEIHWHYNDLANGEGLGATRRREITPTKKAKFTPAPPRVAPIPPISPMPDDAVAQGEFPKYGVMCTDAVNPKDPKAWWNYAQRPEVQQSLFGPAWSWTSSLCAGWPGSTKGAFRGPFYPQVQTPPLVVGNKHDPATPLVNAQKVAAATPGARLITTNLFGHVAGDRSTCALTRMRDYMSTGRLPEKDVNCTDAPKLYGR